MGTAAPQKPSVGAQACPAGQVWNGVQCVFITAQQCAADQTRVGATCQPDCTFLSAGAQGYIELLRMARYNKDEVCLQNPNSDECRSAEATYNLRLNEYRGVLAGVPIECGLPDPISI
jgi:hypothetical protein